jgi:hypothetical protein
VSVRFLLSICLLVILQSPGGAQDSAPAGERTLDFSAGFAKLVALGLPPLEPSAKWVVSRQDSLPYQFRRAAKSFKGNAWLTGSGKDARLVHFGAVAATEGKPTSATPDLDKDLAALTAAIRKSDPYDDDSDDLLGSRYSSSEVAPQILLFATQLYQTGRGAQANQLVTALFAVVREREAVVDGAINLLADHAYAGVFDAFVASGDWAAFHQAVTELFAKFPRGWAAREAVALLLPQLEKQAKGAEPLPPAIAGVEIDPRAVAIIAELTAKPVAPAAGQAGEFGGLEGLEGFSPEMLRELPPEQLRMILRSSTGRGHFVGNTWLLDAEAPAATGKQSPLARLAALKMAALPALAALLGDPFLTHLANQGSDRGSFSSFSSDSPEEALLLKWAALSRPQTRGEIARRLLQATLPDPYDEMAQADDETLRQAALDFWRANQAANREELAALFLRGGTKSQAATAVAILAASAEPKFHQLFEAHVLAQDPAFASYEEVRTYLKARRLAAKPFFESYAKLVRSQTPADAHTVESGYDEYQYMLRNLGGVEKLLKSLSALVEPEEPRAVAVRIAKGDPKEAEEALANLRPLMEDLSPLKQLHAFLEGANAATTATVRARFLQGALRVRWPGPAGVKPAADDGKPPPPPPLRKVSAPEEKVWRKLMADQRKFEKEVSSNSVAGETLTMVAELAYAAYEHSVNPGGLYELSAAADLLDRTFADLLKETATARLAGRELPALPDAKRVTAERLGAIVAAAGGKKTAEIPPYIKTLTPDERAAWAEWLEDPEDPPMPDSVKALAWFVTAKSAGGDRLPPPAKYTSTVEPGFLLTPEWLAAHLASLVPKIDSFSPYGLVFNANRGSGLEVEEILVEMSPPAAKPAAATPNDEEEDGEGEDGDEDEDPLDDWRDTFSAPRHVLLAHPQAVAAITVSGRYNGPNVNLMITKDGKLAVAPEADADETAPADPLAAIKPLFGEDGVAGSLYVLILTRKHAEILFKGSDDEEDSLELLPPP